MIDGVRIGNMSGAGQWHNFVPDQGLHAGSGDRLRGGVGRGRISGRPEINHVPKEGGNSFRG